MPQSKWVWYHVLKHKKLQNMLISLVQLKFMHRALFHVIFIWFVRLYGIPYLRFYQKLWRPLWLFQGLNWLLNRYQMQNYAYKKLLKSHF